MDEGNSSANDLKRMIEDSMCAPDSLVEVKNEKSSSKLEKRIKKHLNKVNSFSDKENERANFCSALSVRVSSSNSTKSFSSNSTALTSSSSNATAKNKDVCLIEESPYYIHKVSL